MSREAVRKPSRAVGAYSWDYALVASRVRQRRQQFGWTIAYLAEKAGISRHTVLRIEQGVPVKDSTIISVRKCLRLFTDQLTARPTESPNYRVHRHERTNWLVSIQKTTYTKAQIETDPVHVDDPGERRRLGSLGFQPFFTAILQSELPDGVGGHALMELHSDSWVDSHYGEEFVYCLRGPVKMVVDGDACVLEEGDAIAFDAKKPHQYCLVEPLAAGEEPKRILLVVTTRPDDRQESVN